MPSVARRMGFPTRRLRRHPPLKGRDSLATALKNNLAQIADLKVVSRTSVMQYRDPARNLKKIGEALQVAYVTTHGGE